MRVKDEDTLVFSCALEEKALLVEAVPDIYFETDHYKNWPAILVRLSAISDHELQHCLKRAFLLQAPAKLLAVLNNQTAASPKAGRGKRA
jgi:hypothetical protein